jgi:hypothetical protein
MHPVFVFLDHDAEQFQMPSFLFGDGIFGRFHEAFRGAKQSVVFRLRPDDHRQDFTEEFLIAAFVE